MAMNVIDDESDGYLLLKLSEKLDQLIVGKVVIKKRSYYNIILLASEFFTENIQRLELNMRVGSKVLFRKRNDIWIRIYSCKNQSEFFVFTPRVNNTQHITTTTP